MPNIGYRVYLGRSGPYLRRVNGEIAFADATSAPLPAPATS